MDETKALGSIDVANNLTAGLNWFKDEIGCTFAGKNVSERRESVVERLVVNASIEVLDEDVALARSSEGRITLAPHDSDGFSLSERIIICTQVSALTISRPPTLMTSKFMVSRARSASAGCWKLT